jgi:hypothetical protein
MHPENPYRSDTGVEQVTRVVLKPTNRAMWRAYLIAPAIAPIAFVGILLLVVIASNLFGFEINPASVLILPVLAMTVGLVSSYVVAGVLGMPIAFFLRQMDRLSGWSIHLAALAWALFFSSLCALYFTDGNMTEFPWAFCYVGIALVPSVLLSGTVFWLLLRGYSTTSIAN